MHARTLPPRHGLLWLLAGFALFRRNPPLLTVLSFSYLLLLLFVNLVPFIGPFLLSLLLPSLTTMLGNGCAAIEKRRVFDFAELVAGLAERRVAMMQLGGLHLLGSLLLLLTGNLLGIDLTLDPEMSQERLFDVLRNLGLVLLLSTPLLMAFWFAPLLTAWDKVPPVKAVFFSFIAAWRNWRAFGVYGLLVALIGLVAPAVLLLLSLGTVSGLTAMLTMVLRLLLLFVLAPVLVASVYLSYRDVFRAHAATPAAHVDVIA